MAGRVSDGDPVRDPLREEDTDVVDLAGDAMVAPSTAITLFGARRRGVAGGVAALRCPLPPSPAPFLPPNAAAVAVAAGERFGVPMLWGR